MSDGDPVPVQLHKRSPEESAAYFAGQVTLLRDLLSRQNISQATYDYWMNVVMTAQEWLKEETK